MTMKRQWIAVFAIPVCLLSVLIIGSDRSLIAAANGSEFTHTLTAVTCTINTGACLQETNNGKGSGLAGISLLGKGVVGQTKFNSTSSGNGTAGVYGTDLSASGAFNSGVSGLSVRGSGVSGNSSSGDGVDGFSSSRNGVQGISTSTGGSGVYGQGSTFFGVAGRSTSGTGVAGFSTDGSGMEAASSNFIGAHVSGGAPVGGVLFPALSINSNPNNHLIDACSSSGPNPCGFSVGHPSPEFIVTNQGNIIITGQIFTSGSCSNGCAPTPSTGEERVQLFTPQESLPTVEDYGQAQLVRGRTYVRIDPRFANTMDSRAAYMVVITPEGDSNGLYVVNKTSAGFEVHENRSGRSTLAFSYRIVAKPFGLHPARLQMITVSRPGASLPKPRIR